MPHSKPEKVYREDERLREIQDHPDRRMTREEWEQQESAARQAAHKRHQQTAHDREVQQASDKEKKKKQAKEHPHWGKIALWAGVGLIALLLVFVLGYLPHRAEKRKADAAAKQREREQPEVEVMQLKRGHAPGELTVPGTTSALTEAYLYARANGYLKRRYVDIGDRVHKGQLLALIDAPELDQQVAQARDQLRQAEAQVVQQQAQLDLNRVTWERWRTLVAKGVFSRQEGDQREADYLAQQAVVASAQRNVASYRANLARAIDLQSYERLTAPFDGVVTQRNADVGALIGSSGAASAAPLSSSPGSQTPTGGSANVGSVNTGGSSGSGNEAATPSGSGSGGGAIFAVAQVDTLRILVSVPEGYATSIHRGMPARIFVQERPNKPIDGTVTRTAASIDQNSRTMLTEVDIANRDRSLYPGMYAVVSFVQARGESPLTVPGDAVVVRQDRTSVALVRDGKIQMVPIEIGRDYGPSVEVTSGLHEGDMVVTTVNDAVQPGVPVRVRQTPQAGQSTAQNGGGGGGGAQTNQRPDSGPNEYGDQSIVNSKTESTTPKGKQGQSGGQQSGHQGGQRSGKGSDGAKGGSSK